MDDEVRRRVAILLGELALKQVEDQVAKELLGAALLEKMPADATTPPQWKH